MLVSFRRKDKKTVKNININILCLCNVNSINIKRYNVNFRRCRNSHKINRFLYFFEFIANFLQTWSLASGLSDFQLPPAGGSISVFYCTAASVLLDVKL